VKKWYHDFRDMHQKIYKWSRKSAKTFFKILGEAAECKTQKKFRFFPGYFREKCGNNQEKNKYFPEKNRKLSSFVLCLQ